MILKHFLNKNLPQYTFLVIFICFSSWVKANTDTLRVGYKLSPPFVVKTSSGLSGPSVWLWESIAKEKNIPFKYQEMSFDALLLNLESNQLDLAISPVTITYERSKKIDFSLPYHIAYSSLLEKESSKFRKVISFIKSFFSITFLRLLLTLVFIILVFGFLIWFFERKENTKEFSNDKKGIWEGFWWSAVTMTTVGYGDKSPESIGGRVVALVWMFTAIIIISGFTASFASALTLNRISSTNNQIEDYKQSIIGTVDKSATLAWLKSNFYTNKIIRNSLDELIIDLDDGKISVIAFDRPVLNALIKNDKNKIAYKVSDVKFNPQFYAFGISKSILSEIQEEINSALLKTTEKMDWRVLLSENELN